MNSIVLPGHMQDVWPLPFRHAVQQGGLPAHISSMMTIHRAYGFGCICPQDPR